jgi:hypothetical protein
MTACDTTKRKFAKGDRVKLSAKDAEARYQLGIRMPEDRGGTILFHPREGNRVGVLWDGTRRPQYIDPDFLEIA